MILFVAFVIFVASKNLNRLSQFMTKQGVEREIGTKASLRNN